MPNKGKLLDHNHLLHAATRDHYLYEVWGDPNGPFYAECMCPFEGLEHERKFNAVYELQQHLAQMWAIKPVDKRLHIIKSIRIEGNFLLLCACGWLSEAVPSTSRAQEEKEHHLRLVLQYGDDARSSSG
jgi:hypothetical protein